MTPSQPPPRNDRPYDVVLWGATGFTGRLVAEYLVGLRARGSELRLALAGRNRDKLERVRADLRGVDPSAAALPLVLADAGDPASLEALADSARVVCTTVGPYAKHGRELAAACAGRGAHYCDITGEVPFVRDSIDRNHDRARATGARLVHCCGFDSIPSDLGVFMVYDHARRLHGAKLGDVDFFVAETKGSVSGGTAASMLHLVDAAARDRAVRRLLADPYALSPDRAREPALGDESDQRGARWSDALGAWTAPFLMAAVNTRVVRRSNALLDYAYGERFRYRESMATSAGPKGALAAAAVTGGLAGFVAAAAFGPTRRLLERALPAPGEGPSKARREAGYFRAHVVASTDPRGGGAPARLRGLVEGTSDPGYGETAKMLSEAAVCLALEGDQLESPGGVLTPAACFGMRLVERLRSAGMTFRVVTDA
ncbi:MAG TPA: saccharopine dehydrogenase NADP-binding domain-containing protein [Polyangiaceae bacterium]|nr:saccharopine dehydrogenase NADP-binding domain-containing protein [Polyangiaceae bacterium]